MAIKFLLGVWGFLAKRFCFMFVMCFTTWLKKAWLKDWRESQRKKKHIKLQNERECRNLKEKIHEKNCWTATRSTRKIGETCGGPMYKVSLLVVILPLEPLLSWECEEGKKFETRIDATFQFTNDN